MATFYRVSSMYANDYIDNRWCEEANDSKYYFSVEKVKEYIMREIENAKEGKMIYGTEDEGCEVMRCDLEKIFENANWNDKCIYVFNEKTMQEDYLPNEGGFICDNNDMEMCDAFTHFIHVEAFKVE